MLTLQQVDEILKAYPDGNVPVIVTIDKDIDAFGRTKIEIMRQEEVFRLKRLQDNYEYKIALVSVLSPGQSLDNKVACIRDYGQRRYGPRYSADVIKTAPSCAFLDQQGDFSAITYKLTDLVFSSNQYTQMPNGDKVYSFRQIGKYWENLLEYHRIVDTRLGKNPKFAVTVLDPVFKELPEEFGGITPTSTHTQIDNFFREVKKENKDALKLDEFDFVVFVYYNFPNDGEPNRGFRATIDPGEAQVSFSVRYTHQLWENDVFTTIIHELGHVLFDLEDLYTNRYAHHQRVPDPSEIHQSKACIMQKTKSVLRDGRRTWIKVTDPQDQILCAENIVKITGENPNCSLADYYMGNCGECTSENYISCARQ